MNECINLLVGCVWNLNDFGARKHAVRTIETLISQGNCSSLSSQLLSEFQANQHDPRIAGLIARIESAQPDVKKTVVLALDQVIHNAVNELLKIEDVLISLKKQNTFDPAASSMLLDDVRAGGIDSTTIHAEAISIQTTTMMETTIIDRELGSTAGSMR